jgi:hypothetical protein
MRLRLLLQVYDMQSVITSNCGLEVKFMIEKAYVTRSFASAQNKAKVGNIVIGNGLRKNINASKNFCHCKENGIYFFTTNSKLTKDYPPKTPALFFLTGHAKSPPSRGVLDQSC